MPTPHLKPLRRGTSLASLKKYYDVEPPSKDVTKLCKSAKRIIDQAKVSLKERDEEEAYIFFMKFLNIISFVHKSPDYKKKKEQLDALVPANILNDALQHAENLSGSLGKRYEILNQKRKQQELASLKIQEDEKKDKATDLISSNTNEYFNNKNKLVSLEKLDEIPQETEVNGLDATGSISSMDLLKHLQKDSSRVLIMDTRPLSHFMESHINFDVCLSIPDEVVNPGCSASQLAQKIPSESKVKWEKRLKVDFLVLLDWFSSSCNLNPDSKVACLRKILVEWDPSVTYNSKPVILDGGYEDFLNHYPMMCTNPKPHIPHQSFDDLLSIDDVEYPPLVDDPSSPSKYPHPSQPNIAAPDKSLALDVPLSQLSLTDESFIPNVDRSSKAAALEKYRELERKQAEVAGLSEELGRDRKVAVEKLSELKKQNKESVSEDEKHLLHRQVNQLQEDIDALERKQQEKDAENNHLRQELETFKRKDRESAARKIPKPIINRGDVTPKSDVNDKPVLKGKDSIEVEGQYYLDHSSNEVPVVPNDKGVSKNSIPNELDVPSTQTTFSGMKRSRSSPNIAQLGHDLDAELKSSTPHIDRSKKPSTKEQQNIEYFSRQRNFHEVYGTDDPGLTGLKNLGNSCYMNSILQCISNTSLLNNYFCLGKYKEDLNRNPKNPTKGEVAEEVAHVVRNLWYGQYRSIACRDLKAVVGQHMHQFRGSLQQDSHEFLTFLLDWLHNDLKVNTGKAAPKVSSRSGMDRDARAEATKAWEDFKKYNDSIILSLFFMQQVSTVSCASCSVKSYTYEEPTSNLTLLLPVNASNRCTLVDCFRLYTNRERICGYKCESCNGSHEAEKKVDLCRLPPVLVIHLKRFYSDGFYQKRQTFVDFPLTGLDLKEFTLDKQQKYTVYNLYAVSNHYGTLEGGHYTAYCRNGDRWFKFDDHEVSEIRSPSDVKSSNAYILFYAAV